MTDQILNYQVNVPDGCMATTKVLPIKMLSQVPHIRTINEGLSRLALDKELNGTDIRVLLYITSIIDYENFLQVSQNELAQGLGIVRTEVTKSIKKLIQGDYLRIVGNIGRQNIYRLNPHFAFKSRAKNFAVLCRQWDEETDSSFDKDDYSN